MDRCASFGEASLGWPSGKLKFSLKFEVERLRVSALRLKFEVFSWKFEAVRVKLDVCRLKFDIGNVKVETKYLISLCWRLKFEVLEIVL